MKTAKTQPGLAEMFDHLAPPVERQSYSLGYCCQLMEISIGQLRVCMEEAAVRFDHCTDGVGYVTGDDLIKIMGVVKKCRDEIETAYNATPNN